jgi:hypothetical protein
MSSARLEVINDDPSVAPRMSRTLPAALNDIVAANAYEEFCIKMDELFESLDSEYRRRKKRFWYMYGAIYFWVMFFIIAGINLEEYALFALMFCAVHIGTVWFFTERPAGVKSDKESMRDIRLECDKMTNRIPFVSFHVVLMAIPAASRGAWLQMNTIDHIAVSISPSASATGTASAAAVSAVVNNAYDEKMNEAADNHQPVVYAQAVVSGNYQSVPSGDGVELV